jgi:integrase
MFDTMLGDFGALVAADVTRTQAFDLIQSFASTPVVASKLRAELGGAWDYALDAGRLPDNTPNWWRLILRGKLKSKGKKIQGESVGTAKRVLTPQEAGVLIRWLPNFTALLEDVLTLYLWTAARGSEIVLMEGREIILDAGQWWWEQPKAKTKNARHERATDLRLPLFGRALAVVLRRKELYGEGWLFPARLSGGRVEPVQQKTIQSTVYYHQPYSLTRPDYQRLRLPVTHWAPHDLRRTARTRLSALGCPRDVAETIIGHLLPGVEGVYNQYTFDAEKVQWLKRLSEHLEEIAVQ